MTVLSIIKEIQEAKGTNAKKAILAREKANANLSIFLWMTYEPSINYYMLKLPNDVVAGSNEVLNEGYRLDILKNIYEALANRRVTGLAAKQFIKDKAIYLDEEGLELLRYMILRDIKAGAGAGSINKNWPGLLTIVPYMRCVLPKDSDIKNWGWGTPGFQAYSQIKADGMFAIVEFNPSAYDVAIISRAGSRFPLSKSFDKVVAAAKRAATGCTKPVQFHGELLIYKDGKLMKRAEGNGIFNSLLQTGEEIPENMEVHFVVWDMVDSEVAVSKGKGDLSYSKRFNNLNTAMSNVVGHPEASAFRAIETRIVKTFAEAVQHLQEALARGEEGTVIKRATGVWLDGDSKDQVKGKIDFTVDLAIIGYKDGDQDGKHKDTFGSLICSTDDGLLVVNVSGMTDALRKLIHNNREAFTHRIIAVTANDITYSTDGGKTPHSLFLPRLTEIREDKKTADKFADVVKALDAARSGENIL
jgi:DNA ligase-1